jgi:hypothetical protein
MSQRGDPQTAGLGATGDCQTWNGEDGIDPRLLILGGDQACPSNPGFLYRGGPSSADQHSSAELMTPYASDLQTTAGFSYHQTYQSTDHHVTWDNPFPQSEILYSTFEHSQYSRGHQAAGPVHDEAA